MVTNLRLDRAAIDIAKYHARGIRAVEELGGRIPHTIVIVWTGAALKVRIAGETDFGSIRPNYHVAVHDAHRPASDSLVYNTCKNAARQIGELSRWFHGWRSCSLDVLKCSIWILLGLTIGPTQSLMDEVRM